jgi:hypothetical protein
MLQVYRVTSAFEAKQLRREPLWVETFEPGDLLVALSSDGFYTTFCRHDEFTEFDARDQFILDDQEFKRRTALQR